MPKVQVAGYNWTHMHTRWDFPLPYWLCRWALPLLVLVGQMRFSIVGIGLNQIYSFIIIISSTNKYSKHKSSMLIWVLCIITGTGCADEIFLCRYWLCTWNFLLLVLVVLMKFSFAGIGCADEISHCQYWLCRSYIFHCRYWLCRWDFPLPVLIVQMRFLHCRYWLCRWEQQKAFTGSGAESQATRDRPQTAVHPHRQWPEPRQQRALLAPPGQQPRQPHQCAEWLPPSPAGERLWLEQ